MKKKLSFEAAIEELEDIVSEMESEELSLKDAVAAYQRSQKLIQNCQEELNQAQTTVKKLMPGIEGDDFELEDFDSTV